MSDNKDKPVDASAKPDDAKNKKDEEKGLAMPKVAVPDVPGFGPDDSGDYEEKEVEDVLESCCCCHCVCANTAT
jgi:hypothetical protein